MPLFFKLFRIHDKDLRKLVYTHIVGDIRYMHRKQRDNKALQNFMYQMMNDPNEFSASQAMDLLIDVSRKSWYVFKVAQPVTEISPKTRSRGKNGPKSSRDKIQNIKLI